MAYSRTLAAEQPKNAEAIEELAGLFCKQSQLRAEQLFHSLWRNADGATYAAAQDVLGGRHTWLEEGVLDPSGDGPLVPEPGRP